ncbi:hypothetical protein [Roseibium album]|uniref:hypothetical protein n=1 Tax=Roseibium album TaxID=311410 RepID=UPI003BAE6E07
MKKFSRRSWLYAFVFILIEVLIFPSIVKSSENKKINPSWAVEDQEIENFVRAMIQVYLFYAELTNENTSEPNFIFLSGRGYIENGRINKNQVQQFFPDMSDQDIEELKGQSDVCLVFTLAFADQNIVVGINDTRWFDDNVNIKCFLDLLSFFVDEGGVDEVKSEDIREYSRNLIDKIRRDYK